MEFGVAFMTNFFLTGAELKDVLSKLVITEHAKQRMKERLGIEDEQVFISELQHCGTAWKNKDEAIIMMLPNEKSVIIEPDRTTQGMYAIITIRDESNTGTLLSTKCFMAFKGKNRKFKKGGIKYGRK